LGDYKKGCGNNCLPPKFRALKPKFRKPHRAGLLILMVRKGKTRPSNVLPRVHSMWRKV